MTTWVLDWLRAFATTLAVEAVIAVPLLARHETSLARRFGALALVNLATHPLVWFLFPGLTFSYPLRVGLSEAWAVGGETVAYLVLWPTMGAKRAAMLSLLANSASFGVGLLLMLL